MGASVWPGRAGGDSPADRFVSGCSGAGVLAFLFPRSELVNEDLLDVESDPFCSLLLDVAKKAQNTKIFHIYFHILLY